MTTPLSDQIRDSLTAGREEADRILATAAGNAAELTSLAAETDRAFAGARLERLAALRQQIEGDRQAIASACATLSEALATTTLRLAQAAREADFSNPPWPEGIGRTFEIRLAQTREVTFRIDTGARSEADSGSDRL